MNSRKIFVPGIILTLVYGVIYFFLGEYIVRSLFGQIWNPLAVALYVLVFAVLFIPVMLLIARGSGNIQGGVGGFFLISGIMLVILFAVTMLLEFLYELGGDITSYKPTSYIFVIDDSLSMYENDPSNERVKAIPEIMEDQDIPYAVYKFSDDAYLIRQMGDYKKGERLSFLSDGEYTMILESLMAVGKDISEGKIDGGLKPKVLLLSDGQSYSDDLEQLWEQYKELGISISTVGFGSADDDLMKKIAEGTGGVYIKTEDISSLRDDIEQSISSFTTRTLLTPRRHVNRDVLYMILRILFLSIIGAILGLFKKNTVFGASDTNFVVVLSAVLGVIAAIVCEFLVGSNERLARLLVDILWALTIVRMSEFQSQFPPSGGVKGYRDKKPNINGTPYKIGNKNGNNNGNSGNPNNGSSTGGWGSNDGSGSGWGSDGGSGSGWGSNGRSGSGWGSNGGSGSGWGSNGGAGSGWGSNGGSGSGQGGNGWGSNGGFGKGPGGNDGFR